MEEILRIQKNVRAKRRELKLSRKELARRSTVSVFTIVDMELGRSHNLKVSTLILIAKALGVSIEDLLK